MNKLNGIQKRLMLGIVGFIVVLSTFFHYPIQIIDALTLEALPDFDIQISIWRILFEPILGLMLFFNRGIFSLEENIFVLYWVLIIFIVYTFIKFITTKDKKGRKKFITSQLINLPLVVGLWFLYFVIVIFMSKYLPNNTIVNNSADTILVTTHSHTEFSHDGLISQNDQWEWHKKNNFDAFFITDHNNHSKTLDFVNAQRKGEFPIEPLVMCGEEFSGTNHLSLLGLKRKFNTKEYSDERVIDSVRANGGVVLVNHWFDGERKTLDFFKDLGVDGFEIENTATERSYNRKVYHQIKEFCESNKLIMNGGLDFHGYGNVCSIWNGMEIPGWKKLDPVEKEVAILNVIRNRDQSKLKVLLYTDRPYYTTDYLFLRPIINIFNYFRTLQIFQVLSWIFWILFIYFLRMKIVRSKELSNNNALTNRIIPLMGVLSAIFMLVLAMVYYAKADELAGTENHVFTEYSEILFYTGVIFLIYTGLVSYFRIFKKSKN